MVKAAVIIHTGTYFCDFPSTFAVCPSMLSSDDINKIRKQVLAATRSIDDLNKDEIRYMVYSSNNHVVAGMVSFLKNLANNNDDEKKFFSDAKGRSMYAFVGFVFQIPTTNIPLINKNVLWDNFKNYMEPIWERTILDTQMSNFTDINFQENNIPLEPVGAEDIDGITLYVRDVNSTTIFSYWLGQALMGKNVSFCSNIIDFRVVKERPFDIITTTTNIVERMKQDITSPTQCSLDTKQPSENIDFVKDNEKKNSVYPKENFSTGQSLKNILLIVAVVLIILVFMVLLLR